MNLRSFTLSSSFLALIAIALLSVGCTKEGPAGPAGPAGATGPAGPAGAQGPKGDTGTANVIYSNWIDVTYNVDADTTRDQSGNITSIDTIGYFANINAPRLTNIILSTGEMKVYINVGTAAQPVVLALPHLTNLTLSGIPVVLDIRPTFLTQRIFLYSEIINPSTYIDPIRNNQKVMQHRYILIPGGTPTGRKATIDWNDYNAVKAYLGLKD